MKKTYTCPCCGYNKLEVNPYSNMPENPHPVQVQPPYEDHWGMASYEICPCCGFEFGNDDRPMHEENATNFQEYLRNWFVNEKGQWFEERERPKNFDLQEQLELAGIAVPDYVKRQKQLT